MRSPARVAAKTPNRTVRTASKTRGTAPLRVELARAMVDALNDILRYENALRRRPR